jgi:hypothetical protein
VGTLGTLPKMPTMRGAHYTEVVPFFLPIVGNESNPKSYWMFPALPRSFLFFFNVSFTVHRKDSRFHKIIFDFRLNSTL